jgi:hypothetical protein
MLQSQKALIKGSRERSSPHEGLCNTTIAEHKILRAKILPMVEAYSKDPAARREVARGRVGLAEGRGRGWRQPVEVLVGRGRREEDEGGRARRRPKIV